MPSRSCAALLLLTFLMACGGDPFPDARPEVPSPAGDSPDPPTSPTTSPTTSSTPIEVTPSQTSEPPEPGTRIVVSDSEFGPMLFDSSGQAIYLFDVETTSKPQCYDACADAWPPVLTTGDPAPGPGVDGSLLGTAERSDGTVQVTYNDHPLYFYAHEGKGEVLCHDVFLNGGNWYVVRPGGDAAPPG